VQFPVALRPRRAEQDFRACGVDATPERDAAPQWLVCLRAPSRSHPHDMGRVEGRKWDPLGSDPQ